MPGPLHHVFVSYSHRDAAWKERVVKHLRVPDPDGGIDVWDDSRIGAGDTWQMEIERAIERAHTAILLVSADFLTSDFIRREEVVRILARRQREGLRVIPVVVRPCAWETVEWLVRLQVRPPGARALSDRTESEVEGALTALAREVGGFGTPPPPEPVSGLTRVAVAVLPAAIFAAAALGATSVRVRTPVQLDVVTGAVSFVVAAPSSPGSPGSPLLSSTAPLSRVTLERCDEVVLPPLRIGHVGAPAGEPSPVTFRCDPFVPGSRVTLRAPGAPAVAPLGTLGRIVAIPGDRVSLTLVDPAAPSLRVEIAGNHPPRPVDLTLGIGVPFEAHTEFAGADAGGAHLAVDSQGIGRADMVLPPSSLVRLARLQPRQTLDVVLEPAGAEAASRLFAPVDIAVERLSLFRRSDVDDGFVSTALEGTLTYPTQTGGGAVPIERGVGVTLREPGGFRLTRLRFDREKAGLGLQIRGEAREVWIGGQDRRLTLFESVLPTRTARLALLGVAVLLQWMWFRQQ